MIHLHEKVSCTNKELIALAQAFDRPAKFKKHASREYRLASRRGILNLCTAHMTGGNKKWTLENLKAAAAPFNTRKDFRKNNPQAFYAADRLKVMDECCLHMRYCYRQWTHELIMQEALKHKSSSEFRKANEPAWQAAHERGFEKYSGHMTPKYKDWTEEALHIEAQKYPTRTKFARGSNSPYQICCEKGLDTYCGHMKPLLNYYSDDELMTVAAKYPTRSKFAYGNPNEYAAAAKRKKLETICTHMVPAKGSSDFDIIYMWQANFDGVLIYKVGVTSFHRQQKRIQECAGSHGVKAKMLRYDMVNQANKLEKQILKLGKKTLIQGDGCTEMRFFTDQELLLVLDLIDQAAI